MFGLGRHLTDRRVHIEGHRSLAGTGARPPRTAQRYGHHLLQLAYMTPGERTQEGPHSGRGHHRMGQHPVGGTGPEPTHMVNMRGAHQHRSYQRAYLTTRMRATHPAAQPHRPIHQTFQTQTVHQRPGRQQPSVGHQPLIIENRLIPVDILQYSTHRKCLQTPSQSPCFVWLLSQIRGTFRVYPPPTTEYLPVDSGLEPDLVIADEPTTALDVIT